MNKRLIDFGLAFNSNILSQVYEGSAPQYELEELEPGGEYLVRVCYVRGGLAGAWSPAARLALPAAVTHPRPRRARPVRHLSPRQVRRVLAYSARIDCESGELMSGVSQAALLMAGGFLVLAVLVAVLVAQLVEPRP